MNQFAIHLASRLGLPAAFALVMGLAPSEGWGQTALRSGEERTSTLEAGGQQEFTIECQAGQSLEVELSASTFLARITAQGPSRRSMTTATGHEMRLRLSPTENGTHQVRVEAIGETGGQFQIRGTVSGTAATCPTATPVKVGDRVTGRLEPGDQRLLSGAYNDLYSLSGPANQQVTVTLTSTSFDSYLSVRCPAGGHFEDDDSAGQGNARVRFRLRGEGEHLLGVTTGGTTGGQGPYVLTVE